jgi:hypothetical protein
MYDGIENLGATPHANPSAMLAKASRSYSSFFIGASISSRSVLLSSAEDHLKQDRQAHLQRHSQTCQVESLYHHALVEVFAPAWIGKSSESLHAEHLERTLAEL